MILIRGREEERKRLQGELKNGSMEKGPLLLGGFPLLPAAIVHRLSN